MSEVAVGVRGSPDSDCNSNHPGSTSYLSNTSSQDIDFIQDNSDYQWFLDYGCVPCINTINLALIHQLIKPFTILVKH